MMMKIVVEIRGPECILKVCIERKDLLRSHATFSNHCFVISVTTMPPIYYATTGSSDRILNPDDENIPPWNEDLDHQIIVHHAPPTLEPFPTVITHKPQIVYENYDTKYNVYDSEPEPKNIPENSDNGGFRVTEAANPGTLLVIGIIAGALIAVILIVIIVLKMRTRVEIKEETRTYQFQAQPQEPLRPPTVTNGTITPSINGDDTGFETPSIVGISAVPGAKATVLPAGNGFYDKYVNNNKKNNGKPVREWYV